MSARVSAFQGWVDRLLGRGSASIAVPVMDGRLKPNRLLDEAEKVLELPGLDDLAGDGATLYATAGPVLYRVEGGAARELRRFERDLSALAAGPDGSVAVALGGERVLWLRGPGLAPAGQLDRMADRPLRSVNALAFDAEGQLLISDGSADQGPDQWCADLMRHGASGRVGRWDGGSGGARQLAGGLRYSAGVLADAGGVLVSESWDHRVVRLSGAGRRAFSGELPGYPSRMVPAPGGGCWLTCFVCRTQLVEFVLREDEYRERMLAEVPPPYWIAPALSSGHDFLEPLQGAGVKQMGVLKPWAPPRSYGLVVRLDEHGHVVSSLHSQVDGRHHGITGVALLGDFLYVVSRGSGRLLRVPVAQAELGSVQ